MSDFSKLKTIAQAYSDLIDSEDQDSWAEARDEYELTARVDVVLELIAEVESLKKDAARFRFIEQDASSGMSNIYGDEWVSVIDSIINEDNNK